MNSPTHKMSTKKKALSRGASKSQPGEKAYESFVGSVDVLAIWLKSCSSEISRAAFFEIENGLNVFKQSYRVLEVLQDHFEAEGKFELTIAASEGTDSVVKLQFSFVADIHSDQEISKDHADRFAHSELRLVLMPFARQFVSTITSQMAIPPVLLPLLKRKQPSSK